jgi:hypothetical protein
MAWARPDVIRCAIVLDKHPRVLDFYWRQMKAIGYLGSIDKTFGASATTRNWNTITTIVNVLKSTEL